MRWLKLACYILLILVLQTVVFARLNILGFMPDLILISIICYAILEENEGVLFFAFVLALLQGVLAQGIYLNIFSKLIIAVLVSLAKQNIAIDKLFLVIGFTAVFTPVALILEGSLLVLFGGRSFAVSAFIIGIIVMTVYNVVLAPLFFLLIKRAAHA